MDHVINSMQPFLEVAVDHFVDDWRKHDYKKHSDSPYYAELKAILDSANILRQYMGWHRLTIKKYLDLLK